MQGQSIGEQTRTDRRAKGSLEVGALYDFVEDEIGEVLDARRLGAPMSTAEDVVEARIDVLR